LRVCVLNPWQPTIVSTQQVNEQKHVHVHLHRKKPLCAGTRSHAHTILSFCLFKGSLPVL